MGMGVVESQLGRTATRSLSRSAERVSGFAERSSSSSSGISRSDSFASTSKSGKPPKTTGFRAGWRSFTDKVRVACGREPKHENSLKKSLSRGSTVDLDTDLEQICQDAEKANKHYTEQIAALAHKTKQHAQHSANVADRINRGMERATAQYQPKPQEVDDLMNGVHSSPQAVDTEFAALQKRWSEFKRSESMPASSSPRPQVKSAELFKRAQSMPSASSIRSHYAKNTKAPNLNTSTDILANLQKSVRDSKKDGLLHTMAKKSDSVKIAQKRLGEIDAELQSINTKLNGKLMPHNRTLLEQTKNNLLSRQTKLSLIAN